MGQHEAAHLGQKDDQYPFGGMVERRRFVSSVEDGEHPADELPEYAIDFSLKFDSHRDSPLWPQRPGGFGVHEKLTI
jgi:hypothetical protein